jgi:cold shock CspA family protein/ribosome-associated translation inhibitor RaiA
MQIPPEIAFHHVKSSPAAEQQIRDRIAKLEHIYDRLITCRVRVDQRIPSINGTLPPVVRIEMGVPGTPDLVVSHEPEHLLRKFQSPDLRNAINEAFRIAEDRLVAFKGRREGRAHGIEEADSESRSIGQVAEVTPGEDFGFLLTNDGGLLYFHRHSVLAGDFDSLKRGGGVTYVEAMGDTGPVATKVRVRSHD